MSELSDRIAVMETHYRPHAVSPVTARRKVTDTPPPAGVGNRMPNRAANTMAGRKQGARFPGTYRPRAADFAGMLPATTRPVFGSVKPSGGRRIGNSAEQARADGENQARSAWVTARANLERESGDVLPAGAHYPRHVTRKGNLGPSARY
jgi:hypothetical protein